MQSTETATRQPTEEPAASTPSLAMRQSMTLQLVEPTLAALRAYRAEIVEHCDRTLEQLEGLQCWARGTPSAEPPTAFCAIAGALAVLDTVGSLRNDALRAEDVITTAACRTLDPLMYGTVHFCMVALEELARIAVDGPHLRRSTTTAAERLAESLMESSPDPAGHSAAVGNTLRDGLRERGIEIEHPELLGLARRELSAA
jgi:hypothetical protein